MKKWMAISAGERVGAGLVACQQSLLTFQAGLFGAIDALQ